MEKHVSVSAIFALILVVSVLMVAGGVMKVTQAHQEQKMQRWNTFQQCVQLGGSAPDCADAIYGHLLLRE